VSKVLRNYRLTLPDLNQSRFCSKTNSYNGISGYNKSAFVQRLTKAGARIIDPRPAFLDSRGEYYQILRDDVILYRDDHHLTKRGAELMLIPVLEKSFLPYLKFRS
jgi:hypothetical protein